MEFGIFIYNSLKFQVRNLDFTIWNLQSLSF
jgi:hypothetical protein